MVDSGSAGPSQPRIVIVVARDRPELCDYLRRGFAGLEDDIRVVLDRRVAPPDAPRPEPDLRRREDVSAELAQRGFVIIHLW